MLAAFRVPSVLFFFFSPTYFLLRGQFTWDLRLVVPVCQEDVKSESQKIPGYPQVLRPTLAPPTHKPHRA